MNAYGGEICVKYGILLIGFWSGFSLAEMTEDKEQRLDIENNFPISQYEQVCSSIVCTKVIEQKTVMKAGDHPERTTNETIEAIGNVLFVAGEVGFAENLQEESNYLSNN